MSGCIDLPFPFQKSWLWEISHKEIWLSMINVIPEEQRKGHMTLLIQDLQSKYSIIMAPVPSTIMKIILHKHGFKVEPDFGTGHFWVWRKLEEAET